MADIEYLNENTDGLYNDGDQVEQDILAYVKQYPADEYWKVLQKDQRWPVFYHLTEMRENILNWYDFKPDCDILEIGGGMGALTGLLCRKAKTVTTVELTARRAQVIYARHADCDNLKILVGNFNNMEIDQRFDYITLIGVLEYAQSFTPGGDPQVFLERVQSLLKPDGKLLIAIENRFGLKYWCGAYEDHTGKPYDGINGYPDTDTIRTYSRRELADLLDRSGLEKQRFFYPLPDYKLPQVMYSDEYLPKKEIAAKVRKYYLNDPILLADEGNTYSDIVQNGVFPFFANSFFVECGKQSANMSTAAFASFTPDRARDYKVVTVICTDETVKKYAALPQGQQHIQNVFDQQRLYVGDNLVPYKMVDGHLEMPYIDAPALADILCDCIKRNDRKQIKNWLDLFREQIRRSAEIAEINGKDILRHGFVDMTFCNCFVKDDQLLFYDQEWINHGVPVDYLVFRALLVLYWEHPDLEESISQSELRKMQKIDSDTANQYMDIESDFLKQVVPSYSNPFAVMDRYVGRTDLSALERIKEQSRMSTGTFYFDIGSGYSEENAVHYSFNPSQLFRRRIEIPSNTNRIRYDPIEGEFCVLRHLDVLSDSGLLAAQTINGEQENELYLFQTTDPQFEISLTHPVRWIEVSADILTFNGIVGLSMLQAFHAAKQDRIRFSEERDLLSGKLTGLESERSNLSERLAAMETARNELAECLSRTEADRAELSERLTATETARNKLEECLSSTEADRAELSERLTAMETARDNLKECLVQTEVDRDNLSNSLEQTLRELAAQKEENGNALSQREVLQRQLAESQYAYSVISNAACWKITKPVRCLLDWLKRISLFALMIKGLKYLKDNGWSNTRKKLKNWNKEKNRIMEINSAINESAETTDAVLYDSEYQENQDYAIYTTDVKVLAFYLPQFHTFPENDKWWGKGFTEWTNVKKSTPRFSGHYQPRVPNADIGYYCLENIDVIRHQAELAKHHGIYGFCFYYYWFSGKRLMEKPVDQLLEHPEIDLPFCLCWANENWTRRWDGQEQDVLIKQEYTDEDDERFIIDMEKYLIDPRYIRIDGAPLIIIYNPSAMPDCRKSFSKWRETARKIGIGEIKIWICLTWGRNAEMLYVSDLVDAEVEFPPHNIGGEWMELKDIEREGKDCIIYDYHRAVEYIVGTWEDNGKTLLPRHYTCMLAWDNAARRKDGWHAFYKFSLKEFYKWVSEAARQSRKNLPPEERFIFINAWNEWGEGTYLEPEEKYGYANINTVSKAVFDLPFDRTTVVINEQFPEANAKSFSSADLPKIAIQAHIFFLDLIDEMIRQFNNLPYPFDLYVTTDTEKKKKTIVTAFKKRCKCKHLKVLVLANRGRDVAPFLVQMAPVIGQYEYIGHFHTKKTVTAEYGDDWRRYLFKNLLGNEEYVKRIFGMFEDQKDLGIVFPELYPPIREHAKWTGENEGIKNLLTRMNCDCELPDQLTFPAGNMFWARVEAVKPLFDLHLKQKDFPEESGQRYATIAHQIERSWVYIAKAKGYTGRYIMNGIPSQQ